MGENWPDRTPSNYEVVEAPQAGVSAATPQDAADVMAQILQHPDGGDAVVLPNHYARFTIEPIRFLVENFGACILVGKVIKYTMRYDAKNGLEDLRKAKRCLEMLIKFIEKDPDWWKAER